MNFISTAGSAVVPILIVFLCAAVLALVLTPIVRRIVIRYEIVDQPEERRVNVVPVPRAGGLAVSAAFLLVAGIFLIVNEQIDLIAVPVKMQPSAVAALLLGGAIAAGLGAIDDLFDLRARWQLLGQVAARRRCRRGRGHHRLHRQPVRARRRALRRPVAAGLTIFWVVGMINSINWIDGLDGLSTGVSFIAAVTLGLISLTSEVGQPLIAVMCFALAGALLGFLRWNFHPATIFTGTSGVQFVGFTLAILAILGTAKVAVALLVLGVPIIDTFWIIVRRLSQGRSPFTPRSDAHPPSPARPGAVASADRARDLRDLPGHGRPGAAAVGHDQAVRVRRRVHGLRARPVPADPGRVPATRGPRCGGLRPEPRCRRATGGRAARHRTFGAMANAEGSLVGSRPNRIGQAIGTVIDGAAPNSGHHGGDRCFLVAASPSRRRPCLPALLLAALAPAGVAAAGPIAGNDEFTVGVNALQATLDVLANDTDPDGDSLRVIDVTEPAHGSASPSIDGTAVVYEPDANFHGIDTFDYLVDDGALGTASGTVTVTVNDPPVAVDDPGAVCGPSSPPGNEPFGGAFPLPEDYVGDFPPTDYFILICGLLANDSDPNGDPLTWEIYTDPAHGDVIKFDETFFGYRPDPDYSTPPGDEPGGEWISDSFTYRAFDGLSYSEPATMRYWVAPINDAPSFTPGGDIWVVEDSGTYSATVGDRHQPGAGQRSRPDRQLRAAWHLRGGVWRTGADLRDAAGDRQRRHPDLHAAGRASTVRRP